MIARLACATVLLLAPVTGASAIAVFAGGGFVTAATNECSDAVIFAGLYLSAGYSPANLSGNGPNTDLTFGTLPQLAAPFATHVSVVGAPTPGFTKTKATTVSTTAKVYNARVSINEKPAVTIDTQHLALVVKVKNLSGIIGCDVTLELSLRRAPF